MLWFNKGRLRKHLLNWFYDWDMFTQLVDRTTYRVKEELIRDLVTRIRIDRIKEHINAVEKLPQSERYTTLARLLEDNYKSK